MRRGQLFINNTEVDLTDDISLPITYQISDIRNPEELKGSFSKTITIPASKNNNKLFGHIYEISRNTNVGLINFDPDFNVNKKASARLLIDGVEVFNGNAQLMRIVKNGSIPESYEIIILNNVLTLFSDIGNDKLSDIDFSEFDHNYNADTILDSQKGDCVVDGVNIEEYGGIYDLSGGIVSNWQPTGLGYVYPNIDYKQNNGYIWRLDKMYPSIPAYQYIQKILNKYGYTANSNFIGSSFFKHLIVPCNLPYTQTRQEIDNGKTIDLRYSQTPIFVKNKIGQENPYILDGNLGTFKFRDAYSDPANIFDYNLGSFEAKYNGFYPLFINSRINIISWMDTADIGKTTNGLVLAGLTVGYYIKRTDGTIDTLLESSQLTYAVSQGTVANDIDNPVRSSVIDQRYEWWDYPTPASPIPPYLAFGDVVYIGVELVAAGRIYDDATGEELNHYVGIEVDQDNYSQIITLGTDLYNPDFIDYIDHETVGYGQTLRMNNYLPNYPIKDFLMDLIKCFNLQVEVDKDNPKLLNIEPYNDFYTGSTIRDWTSKVDTSKPITLLPMGELDANQYTFAFSEDNDVLNENYQNTFKETYGKEKVFVDNDFIKNTKEIKTTLGASPAYQSNVPGTFTVSVLGHTYPDRIETKPRLLYYNFIQKYADDVLYIPSIDLAIVATKTTYGQALEVDSITAPTFALRFSVVPKVMYYSTSVMTNANFYTRYWKKYIQEITDPDSKIVDLHLRLQATDIQKFSFRDTIFIDGNYFIVNKIAEFNPLVAETTRVELLKLKIYAPSIEGEQDITPSVTTYNLVEGGLNEVRDLGATSYYNVVEGGLNEVRDLGATSLIGIINGGQNIV